MKKIKSKEEFINMYAGKIWSRHELVDEKTGRYYIFNNKRIKK